MVRTMLLALGTFSLLLSACAEPAITDATPDRPEAPSADITVDLAPSFRLANDGPDVTHAPCTCVTPDRQHLVVGTNTGEMAVFSAETQALVRRKRILDEPLGRGELARGGGKLLALGTKGSLVVADVASGAVDARQEVPDAQGLVVSPDGTRCAVARPGKLEVRDAATLALVAAPYPIPLGAVTCLAWHPTEAKIALTGGAKDDEAEGILLVVNLVSRAAIELTGKPGMLYAVAYAPDGSRIAYGGHERKIYVADADGRNERVLQGPQPYWITTIGFSPDGSMILAGDESCDVWLRDVQADGKLIFHGKHHVECWVNQVAWTGNDTFLLACRPNQHAGKPTLAWQNVAWEASLDPGVRQADREVVALRKELAAACRDGASPEVRERLAALRKNLGTKDLADEDLALALLGPDTGPGLPPGASLTPGAGAFYATEPDLNPSGFGAGVGGFTTDEVGDVRSRTERIFDRVLGSMLSGSGGATTAFRVVEGYSIESYGVDFRGLGDASGGVGNPGTPVKTAEEAKERRTLTDDARARVKSDPALAGIIDRLETAARRRRDVVQEVGKRLTKGGFTVNQWRVNRK